MGSEMKTLVIRDKDRSVINIGPWDYGIVELLEEGFDEEGKPAHRKIGERITNPLPDGATSAEEEVLERDDGGLAAANDIASLRRAAYPSIADQLDAFWKGGDQADAMRAKVLSVKARYSK